jgi:hypothetical protein
MKISVIMIDGSFRENCFGAEYFLNQDLNNKEYEVIWVEFYKQYNPELDQYQKLRVITLNNDPGIEYHSSFCFNAGIKASKGELIIIPDADQIVTKDFLTKLWNKHQSYDRLVTYIHRYDEKAKGDLESYEFDELDKKCVMKNPQNYGGCIAVRKKWLVEINGYEQHPIFKSGFHANGTDVYTRFKNLGLAIEWFKDVKLYHPWHPFTRVSAPQYASQKSIIEWRFKTMNYKAFIGLQTDKNIMDIQY